MFIFESLAFLNEGEQKESGIFESVQFLNEGLFLSTFKSREKIIENYKKIDMYFIEMLNMMEKCYISTSKDMIKTVMAFKDSKVGNLTKKINELMYDYNKEIEESNQRIGNMGFGDCRDFSKAYNLFAKQFIFNKADIKDDVINNDLKSFITKYSPDSEYSTKFRNLYKDICELYEKFGKWATESDEVAKMRNKIDNDQEYIDAFRVVLEFIYRKIQYIESCANFLFKIHKSVPKKYFIK